MKVAWETTNTYPNATPTKCSCLHCYEVCEEPESLSLTSEEFKITNRKPGYCVLQQTCGKNFLLQNGQGITRPDVPCYQPKTKPALTLVPDENKTHFNLVKSVCPSLVYQNPNGHLEASVCCSQNQMINLNQEIGQMKQLFGRLVYSCESLDLEELWRSTRSKETFMKYKNIFRCPACYENLLNIYCMTSCDPNQALWMEGVEGFKTISDQGFIF